MQQIPGNSVIGTVEGRAHASVCISASRRIAISRNRLCAAQVDLHIAVGNTVKECAEIAVNNIFRNVRRAIVPWRASGYHALRKLDVLFLKV